MTLQETFAKDTESKAKNKTLYNMYNSHYVRNMPPTASPLSTIFRYKSHSQARKKGIETEMRE
jgi:hypothetical protein